MSTVSHSSNPTSHSQPCPNAVESSLTKCVVGGVLRDKVKTSSREIRVQYICLFVGIFGSGWRLIGYTRTLSGNGGKNQEQEFLLTDSVKIVFPSFKEISPSAVHCKKVFAMLT